MTKKNPSSWLLYMIHSHYQSQLTLAGRRGWESREEEVGNCCPRCRKENAGRVKPWPSAELEGCLCVQQMGSKSADGIFWLYRDKILALETYSLAWETFRVGCLFSIVLIIFSRVAIRRKAGEASDSSTWVPDMVNSVYTLDQYCHSLN